MKVLLSMLVAVSLLPVPALSFAEGATPAPQAQADAVCEHGVKPSLCARCNPKLEAVYKAKGDWCAEHARPESQCAICNPKLAAKGIK